MTDHDFTAEARQYDDRIPDPPTPPANVLPFRRPTTTRVTTPAPRRPEPPRAA